MDAIIRFIPMIVFIFTMVDMNAQHMDWTELAEDTVYYANEYLPDDLMVTPPGPAQVWDFRSLRAPYAISRRIVVTGNKNKVTYANLVNGKQAEAVLQLSDDEASIVQIIEDNPLCSGGKLVYSMAPALKPFFNGEMGDEFTYRGRMQAVFAWPRDVVCLLRPAQLPDSCRITYTISLEIVVDGEGTLYLPTEVSTVYRQHIREKRTAKVETKRGNLWSDITSKVPSVKLVTYTELLRFVSTNSGLELVEIEVKDNLRPTRVEFKTYPLITRVFAEEPSRPDIFAYPNPSFDIVRFQMRDLLYGRYKLKIFNILGVQVKENEIEVDDSRETISIDLGDLHRGTYLFRVEDSFGRIIRTKRIVLIQP